LFWVGWLLMPGVGVTDAAAIFERVGAHREAVRFSCLFHLLSAVCLAIASTKIEISFPQRVDQLARFAGSALAMGACGIAADAILHLVAFEMTAPGVDQAAMLPVMVQLQTTDLTFVLVFFLAFFLGAGALAGAASRAGLVSRWNPRLHGIAFAIAVVGGVLLGPRGGGRAVGLVFLALVSVSIAWVGVALRRAPAT
jgi:hypothetical protein